ncbi:MAG TPA: hypothetical protein PK339_05980 [Flavitalea sp.]|nr:hypothetical protein [Flavitalea sp.]
MRPRILGFLLAIVGFGGMLFAGYVFVTGSGGRGNILEVTSYLIVGAACFFAGISYIYDTGSEYMAEDLVEEEFDDVIPIQQEWRAFHIAASPTSSGGSNTMMTRSATGNANNLKVSAKAMASSDHSAAAS